MLGFSTIIGFPTGVAPFYNSDQTGKLPSKLRIINSQL